MQPPDSRWEAPRLRCQASDAAVAESQDRLWKELRDPLLGSALKGCSTACFALGQSGARRKKGKEREGQSGAPVPHVRCAEAASSRRGTGKTFSIFGFPGCEGLVTHCLRAFFAKALPCSLFGAVLLVACAAAAVCRLRSPLEVREDTTPFSEFRAEVAMLQVHADSCYDLLEPVEKDRPPLKVFVHHGEAPAWRELPLSPRSSL